MRGQGLRPGRGQGCGGVQRCSAGSRGRSRDARRQVRRRGQPAHHRTAADRPRDLDHGFVRRDAVRASWSRPRITRPCSTETEGPNTRRHGDGIAGGVGVCMTFCSARVHTEVFDTDDRRGLKDAIGIDYRGVLYAGTDDRRTHGTCRGFSSTTVDSVTPRPSRCWRGCSPIWRCGSRGRRMARCRKDTWNGIGSRRVRDSRIRRLPRIVPERNCHRRHRRCRIRTQIVVFHAGTATQAGELVTAAAGPGGDCHG